MPQASRGFRLSQQQRQLWLVGRGGPARRARSVTRIAGVDDSTLVRRAVDRVIEQHEILRTAFQARPGLKLPLQVVEAATAPDWRVVDLSGVDPEARAPRIEALLRAEETNGGELTRLPLVHCTWVELGGREALLVTSLPSACADPATLDRFFAALVDAVDEIAGGEAREVEPIQYLQVSEWQHELLADEEEAAEGLAFWRRLAERPEPALTLPFLRPSKRTAPPAGNGEAAAAEEALAPEAADAPAIEHVVREIAPEVIERLRALVEEDGPRLDDTLLAAWQATLWRVSGGAEPVIAVEFDGRQYEELSGVLGPLTRSLPMRLSVHPRLSFADAVRQVAEEVEETGQWQEYFTTGDGGEAVVAVPPIGFACHRREAVAEAADARFELLDVRAGFEPCSLKLRCHEGANGWRLDLQFDPRAFDRADVERVGVHLDRLLAQAAADPGMPLAELDLLEDGERRALVETFNDTGVDLPTGRTVAELFAEAAAEHPERTALVFRGERWTYGSLQRRAARIAAGLRASGAGAERPVALALDRSADAVAALLGVLAAGSAYLPLDPSQPAARLASMLEVSGCRLVLTGGEAALPEGPWRSVGLREVEERGARVAAGADAAARLPADPAALAYVIFTSGSTGRPKGVAVENRQLVNYAHGALRRLDPPPAARFATVSTLAADLGNTGVFGALLGGGTLHVVADEVLSDPRAAAEHFAREPVDVLKIVPSHLEALLAGAAPEEIAPTACLVLGGEASSADRIAHLRARVGCRIVNHYGPTETVVGVLTHAADGADPFGAPTVPIGRPLPNARVYLLDPRLHPVPTWTPGEVFAGGAAPARGYVGRSALTAERFLPDPFSPVPGGRMYRTGDLARHRPDGAVEFLGRVDQQIKLRGFRIELGEIEAVLEEHPGVDRAVVTLHEGAAGGVLAGYWTAARDAGSGAEPTGDELRARLAERLPAYMVPAHLARIDALPLTPNGKVDRRALPAPGKIEARQEAPKVPPRTPVEEALAGFWHDLLGIDQVGVHDDFFVHGGHSLLAARLVARVRETFEVEIPLRALFDAPTVEALAAAVEEKLRDGSALPALPIEPAERDGDLPLSFAQQRLWFFQWMEPESAAYNVPRSVRLDGELDLPALHAAFGALAARHEILRTTYHEEDGRPVQRIHPPAPRHLPVVDLSVLPADAREEEAVRLARVEVLRPFDLAAGPVLRHTVVRLSHDQHLALVTMHHIASDAWSAGILMRELVAFYRAVTEGVEPGLPALPVQYADFAAWQRRRLSGEALEAEVAHWREALAGLPPRLELPTDRPRRPVQRFLGGLERFRLPDETVAALRGVAEEEGVTLFMALLAIYQVLLARYSGQPEMAVGTPVAGRDRREIEGLIGFFVNTLVLRGDLRDHGHGPPGYRDLLHRVRRTALDAYAHQDVPFERLVEELAPRRSLSHTPLFQAFFSLQDLPGIAEAPAELPGLRVRSVPLELDRVQFELTISLSRAGEALEGHAEYDRDLYDPSTVRRLLDGFESLAKAAAEAPERSVFELPILTRQERRTILEEWSGAELPAVPTEPSAPERIVERARLEPGAVAAVTGELELSYGALVERAEALARALRAWGVGPEVRVAVCSDRHADALVALLGVQLAGGAFVPVDPDYPADRIERMLRDSGAPVVLAPERLRNALAGALGEVEAELGWVDLAPPADGEGAPLPAIVPESAAYVIYTSGSTGVPKGSVISHASLAGFCDEMARALELTPEDRMLQFAPLSFDVMVEEIFPTLVAGGAVVIEGDPGRLAPAQLDALIAERGVTLLEVPAAYWNEWAHDLAESGRRPPSCLRLVMVGCARPQPDRLLEWARFDVPISFHFGLTETTVTSTIHRFHPRVAPGLDPSRGPAAPLEPRDVELPIGRPIRGARTYVVDPAGEPVPPGVAGELWIAGELVGRGYLSRPARTAERFVPDPFGGAGQRLYRTGDLAAFRTDGAIDFLGRMDHQVKVRGFRVELGEVEAALSEGPGVRELVADVRDGRLIVWAVPEEGFQAGALLAYAQERLPEFMVPSQAVAIESLPIAPTGKVDRRALPTPEVRRSAAAERVAPRDAVEEALARIWAETLRIGEVGVGESFFELGGDSILCIQVVSRARREGLGISVRDLFEHQTIAELAAVARRVEAPAVDRGPVVGEAPATPIQRWFFDRIAVRPEHFNQAVALAVTAPLPGTVLAGAVAAVLERHDALRARFDGVEEGAPRMVQDAPTPVGGPPLLRVDLSALPEGRREEAEAAAAERAHRGFDLSRGPLVRFLRFVRSADPGEPASSTGRLLCVAHHLVIDAVSWRIVLEDLESACAALADGGEPALPPRGTPFLDWSRALGRRAAELAATPDSADRWVALLGRAPGPLPVDFDAPASANSVASAESLEVALDAETTEALLREVPAAQRTRIDDALLTALILTFAGWSGERRLLVDLEGHGREEIEDGLDLSRTVGWFTALYPVLLDAGAEHPERGSSPGSLAKVLAGIKESLRSVPARGIDHGLLRYGWGDVPPAAGVADAPAPEVAFNYLGQLDGEIHGAAGADGRERRLRPTGGPNGRGSAPEQTRPHRIEVAGAVVGGRLETRWTFSRALHSRATIEALANRFSGLLEELVALARSGEPAVVTPSDFPLVDLDRPAFERLVASVRGGIDDVLPASPAQQGMVFHALHSPDSGVYTAQVEIHLEAEVDDEAFEGAWRELFRRHPILRTSFGWRGLEAPVQVVHHEVPVRVERYDWRDRSEAEAEESLRKLLLDDWERPFDIERAPLMRFHLARLADERYCFVWNHHHLLLDGWSSPILLRELFGIYRAKVEGGEPPAERPVGFRRYVEWLAEQDMGEAERYWRETLDGFSAATPLNVDRQLPDAKREVEDEERRRGQAERDLTISRDRTASLNAFARRQRVTLNTVLQAAWALLLSRYSGQDDVVFGVVTSGRSAPVPGIESILGMFINTLPARLRVDRGRRLVDWLREIQTAQARMTQYEHSPLLDVQGWSDVPRGRPLFESILGFENYPVDDAVREEVGTRFGIGKTRIAERTSYPMTLAVSPGSATLLRLLYDAERFDEATVDRVLGHVDTLLAQMLERPGDRIGDLEMLTRAERHQILEEWTDTAKVCPQVPLVHERFAEHAARRPDAPAITTPDSHLTYGELDRRSNRLAHFLAARGVGPETRVAMATDRTVERVVGIVAVLKAGAAYVSLDPTHPPDRLAFLLEDAGAPVILTQETYLGALPETEAEIFCLDSDWERLEGDESAPPPSRATPDNVAYVVYTSGSTGKPKGVEIPHTGLMNLVRWHDDQYDVRPEDRGTQIASPAFDASIWELWPYLAAGASVHVPDGETRLSSPGMIRWWSRLDVTLAYLMTPLAEGVLEEEIPADLPLRTRALIIGGDRLRRGPDPSVSFHLMNHYGPAEYSVTCTVIRVPPEGEGDGIPTIGRAVDNTQIYLLDAFGRPVPVGVPGELYVAGIGLARGYLDRPGMTAEKFLPDPFAPEPGARMYRTGDLVRYLPDGDIDFMGRLDHQVKLRGLRIELGEIEAVLDQHPAIREVAVLVREDRPGAKRLVAYLVPRAGGEVPPTGELTEFLEEHLPAYMVPSVFLTLEALPLTPNGKIDRRALPAPDDAADDAYVAPRGPLEEVLAGVWSEILGLPRVGVRDDFFELGGHSLLATRLISRVRDTFDVELPLRTIFEAPTVAELAREVEAARRLDEESAMPPLVPVPRDGELVLSFGQQRLWFLDRLNPGSVAYNIPVAFRLRGDLDLPALAAAFTGLARRHEVLRSRFANRSGRPVQVIDPPAPRRTPVIDLSGLDAARREAEAERVLGIEARLPFDLERGPLMRHPVVRLAADDHAVAITVHHVASDGWSASILLTELTALYRGEAEGSRALPEIPVQYADFARWQRDWLSGEVMDSELGYWLDQLRDLPPALELPTDHERPPEQSFRAGFVRHRIPAELSDRVRRLARGHNATLYMTLLSVFTLQLHRLSGQDDVLIGTPIAGRQRAELESLVGFFLNTLVLRTKVEPRTSFADLLRQVRVTALDAFAHQAVPFERLLLELRPDRDLARTPLFQVMFNLVDLPDLPDLGTNLPGLDVEVMREPEVGSNYDLTLYASGDGELSLDLLYNADLFDSTRMEIFLEQMEGLLEQVSEDPERSLGGLVLEAPRAAVLPDPTIPLDEPPVRPVARRFLDRAEASPDRVAVSHAGATWSYGELASRVLGVARHLDGTGIDPRAVVGVTGESTPELVAGVLGVMLAGRTLLTLDPRLPRPRRRTMLELSGAACLLAGEADRVSVDWRAELPELAVVRIDEIPPVPDGEAPAIADPAPDDPAYVFFTSGTSGRPKGVVGRQKGLAHFFEWQGEAFGVGEGDRVAQLTALSFDVVLRDLFLPLVTGAALALPDGHDLSADAVLPWLARERVTTLHTVPSLSTLWIDGRDAASDATSLRRVFFAGEPLTRDRVRAWREAFPETGELINLYGPTETTLAKCWFRVPERPTHGVQPVGRPLPQTQVLVLGPDDRPCGVGEPGEIVIRTPFRSLGYLDGAAQDGGGRFVPNPFRDDPDDLIYRTGDQGRFRPDGELEILGRLDDQVKIRGVRIEPGEVAEMVARHPAVAEAAVVPLPEPGGGKRLVAYLVAEPDVELHRVEVHRWLRQSLPEFMMPSALVILDELPLTANGKLDRTALPAPEAHRSEDLDELVPPRDRLELELVLLWESALDVRPIGVRDDFFELGGHSLQAMHLIARIRERFGRELAVATLFRGATVESLAELLQQDEPLPETPEIVLQPEGEGTPFFCVHASGGRAIGYLRLAEEMGTDRPFYGLQARGFDSDAEPFDDLAAMARHYVDAVRRAQPDGPYLLGGWSFGGSVAFEMARQLRAAGEEVGALLALDAAVPLAPGEHADDVYDADRIDDVAALVFFGAEHGIALDAGELRPLDPEQRIVRAAEKALETGALHDLDAAVAQVRRTLTVYKANIVAAANYRGEPYDGPLTVVRSEGSVGETEEGGPASGWQRLSSRPVAVYTVPGTHDSMIRDPDVEHLAEVIRRVLDEASSNRSAGETS